MLALFVLVCVRTGTGTAKASPGEALKDRQCLFTFASIYYKVCHMLCVCVFLFSSMQPAFFSLQLQFKTCRVNVVNLGFVFASEVTDV